MTDAPNAETKPGPANPQAEGVEEPTPPGGPLRPYQTAGVLFATYSVLQKRWSVGACITTNPVQSMA